MNDKQTKAIAAVGLFTGGILGMVGSLVPSPSFRGLAWGLDGIALILACTLLTVYYVRKGYDTLAAGFLIFAIGEGLILSCNAQDLNADVSTFGAGTGLWTAALALISLQKVFPFVIRLTGFIAAALFAVTSVQIFAGSSLNALTEPLPFYAYPFFAATLSGWGWMLLKKTSG